MPADLKEIYSDLALFHSREREKDIAKQNIYGMQFHEKRIIELAYELTSMLEVEKWQGIS